MLCPRCEGSGQCSECQGQGQIACITCEGSGHKTSSRGQSYPCRSCQGQGHLACSPQCASCQGSGQITTELQNALREKYKTRLENTSPRTQVTYALAGLIGLAFTLGQLHPSLGQWLESHFSNISGLWFQPWRLISNGFLHSGLYHFGFNLSCLLWLGPWLEGAYGSRRFLTLYFLSLVGGSACSSAVHQLQDTPVMSLGASSAIFGLYGALLGVHLRYRSFNLEQIRGSLTWLVLYSGLSWALASSVDHWAHAGGFLAGLAYGYFSARPQGR